jgi:hypothetical protein
MVALHVISDNIMAPTQKRLATSGLVADSYIYVHDRLPEACGISSLLEQLNYLLKGSAPCSEWPFVIPRLRNASDPWNKLNLNNSW